VNIIEKLELLCFIILHFMDSGSALILLRRKKSAFFFMWYSVDSASVQC
jgi:hypothetical protein